jgi:hypothetical protein
VHSRGTIKRGPVTKIGISLARTCLVEAALTFRHAARISQNSRSLEGATNDR